MGSPSFRKLREAMIKEDLLPNIKDTRIIKAFSKVPRELFVHPLLRERAYSNQPLPIAYGQMISQPFIVALMCEILHIEKEDKILDIGTGSGYQAAILSQLCHQVISIERITEMAVNASNVLKQLKYNNVKVVIGDGSLGYKEEAPYDKIIAATATKEIPPEWLKQLKDGGTLVFPKYLNDTQVLVSVKKRNRRFIQDYHDYVYFVPLIKN